VPIDPPVLPKPSRRKSLKATVKPNVIEPDVPIPTVINIKTRLVISYTTPNGILHQSQTQGNYINLQHALSVKNYVDVYGKLICQLDGTFFTPQILSYPNGIPTLGDLTLSSVVDAVSPVVEDLTVNPVEVSDPIPVVEVPIVIPDPVEIPIEMPVEMPQQAKSTPIMYSSLAPIIGGQATITPMKQKQDNTPLILGGLLILIVLMKK
jgi:hypothetical protein